MRVLITGSNGLLGTKLLELLLGVRGVEVMGVSRSPSSNQYLGAFAFGRVDLCEERQVQQTFDAFGPEVVIHTAAMTDVDGCERAPDEAWRQNVAAARHVASAAARAGARVVHLSTEYVFDGEAGPYSEDDRPRPMSVYGRTKWESEQEVLSTSPRNVVARTTVLFGWAPNVRANFVTGLIARLRAEEEVRVVTDQVGSPTLADNLAQQVWALGRDPEARGTFNTVGGSVVDRHSFALQVAEEFGLDAGRIRPITTADLAQQAPRPLRGGLLMDRFRGRFPRVPVLETASALRLLHAQMETGRVADEA